MNEWLVLSQAQMKHKLKQIKRYVVWNVTEKSRDNKMKKRSALHINSYDWYATNTK